MKQVAGDYPRRLFLLLMLVGAGLITTSSLGYFDFETLPPFVVEKLPVRFESLWLFALRIHVASALFGFPLCIALMTRALVRHAAWHRRIGRLTGILVLLALVPSGVILAFDAKGGRLVTVGFLLSGAIVAGFMVHGVAAARRRQMATHARAMRHVFAQMSVAVTSRVMLVLLDAMGLHPDVAYVIALWGPVLLSAAVVEITSPVGNERKVRHEIFSRFCARFLARPFARLCR